MQVRDAADERLLKDRAQRDGEVQELKQLLGMEGGMEGWACYRVAPSPRPGVPSTRGTWRQGGEVSGGGECPKRRVGGRRHFVA